jgi:hypothetical protein
MKKYKIGLLTFNHSNNYGAMLQMYSLKENLLDMGYNVEIIDFINKSENSQKNRIISKFQSMLKYKATPFKYIKRKSKTNKFNEFRKKNFTYSKGKYSNDIEFINNIPEYDAFITGSDQVWNTDITNKSIIFYLGFKTSAKKISFAASFGKTILNNIEKTYIKKYLHNYDAISVREESHKKFLNDKFNLEVEWIFDPIFMTTKNQWENFKQKHNHKKKYVLIYELEYNPRLLECAKTYAKMHKLEIKRISSVNRTYRKIDIIDAGPNDFIGYLNEAEYIVTNSFHGTAFSILLNKQFAVIPHTVKNERLESILNYFMLKNHYYFNKNFKFNIINDFSKIEKQIQEVRVNSIKYLDQNLF